MNSARRALCSVVIGSAVAGSLAQPLHHTHGSSETSPPARVAEALATEAGVSGQRDVRFRVLYTASHLPEAAVAVLESAHGGFAVDRRPGRRKIGERSYIIVQTWNPGDFAILEQVR